jgi:ATP-dependent DNA helicase DinG
VLPAYNYLIVDDAHHLEDATTHQLGYTITHRGVSSLLHQIGCSSSRGGLMSTVLARCQGRIPDELWADLQERIGLLGEKNEQLVAELGYLSDELSVFVSEQEGSNRGQYDYRVRLTRSVRIRPEWEQIQVQWARLSRDLLSCLEELDQVNDLIKDLDGLDVPGYDGLLQESLGMGLRLNEVWRQMESVIASPDDNEITWVRARSRPAEISLCAVPLRVDHLVEQHLVWPKEAVVFTSATLRTGDDFAFIKERLGTVDAEELAVGSPFDYESQVLVYLPTDIPEPNQPYHQKVMNRALIQLAEATRGRTLALFTSYSQLGAVSHGISRPLSERGITVYAQGQGASRSQLLENFRETPQAVLLGTRSFWEGIDVPGEALSCLVIAKLPFAVPTDPVFAARSEEMDDPFMQYAVPDAILRFRQGFGRLIRTKTDRGVVVVMDKRVQTKRYGELFLSSLPCCTIVRGSLADLPGQAAMWIDHGVAPPEAESASLQIDDGELEYVPFDEI